MKLTLILLLFFWDNVDFTLTHEECSELPSFHRAFVLDEYKKPQYQIGDVIYFSCDPGYTTGLNTTYVCTEQGWRAATIGQCVEEDAFPVRLGCTRPPALENGYVLQNSTYAFADGQTVRYQCDHLYTMTGGSSKTCTNGQWKGDLQCQEHCGPPPPLDNGDFLGTTTQFVHNSRVEYTCQALYTMLGEPHKTCLNGAWTGEIKCLKNCDVGLVSDSVLVSPQNVRQLRKGQSLRFRCRVGSHVLRGSEWVRCLEDGQWSNPFPSCTDPHSCGPPPPLENGDFIATTTQFGHNSRVVYQCQDKFVIEGGPHRTCRSGVWTGEIKCLKPCTINPDVKEPNKIIFRYGSKNKLYAPHGDHITFTCASGATHDGRAEMRQQCNDGEMVIPRCV